LGKGAKVKRRATNKGSQFENNEQARMINKNEIAKTRDKKMMVLNPCVILISLVT
jgi:hypothetical protein